MRMTRKRMLSILAVSILISSCSKTSDSISKLDGSKLTFDSVDTLVTEAMSEAEVPGLQLAVFNEKKVVYMKSYGFKDSLKSISMDNHTVLQSASFSKSIFAYVLMKLVEEGRFDLDKPVHEYLDFPIYELTNSRFDYVDLKEDERYKKITGRMLLTHTAGFKNYRRGKLEMYFEPGSQYHYSGEGIILLQSVIEAAFDTDLQVLSEEYLFNPLKMDRSSFIWKEAYRSNTSYGFNRDGVEYDARLDSVAMAAYSCVTTISDFSALITSIFDNALISEETTDKMLGSQHRIRTKNQFGSDALVIDPDNTKKGVELFYGLGWGVLNTPYGRAFFKEGKNPGYQNMCIVFSNGTGLILMTNSDRGEQLFQYLNEKLIGNTYFPWDWESIYPFYVHRMFNELFAMIEEGLGSQAILKKYKTLNLEYDCAQYSELIFSSIGQAFLRKQRAEEAIEMFTINVDMNPNSPDAQNDLGKAYLANEQKDLAIKSFENSLRLDPTNSTSIKMLTEIRDDK